MLSLVRVNAAVEPTVAVGLDRPAAPSQSRLLSRALVLQSRQFVSNLLHQETVAAALDLPLPVFGLVWVAVVASHLLCAAFLAGLAATYYYCTNPVMAYYVQLWAPSAGNYSVSTHSECCSSSIDRFAIDVSCFGPRRHNTRK
jgi:multisubunit Na+/H+ antiporter MnhG subunit